MDRRSAQGRSEDFIYLDTEDWTDERIAGAEELRQELGYFVEGVTNVSRLSKAEYPGT